MQLGFYFDQQRCTGCYTCVVACKEWHGVPPGAAAWCRLNTVEKGAFPRPWLGHLFLACYHCAQPACVTACPTEALTKRAQDGIVVVDRELCLSGCRACLAACPFQSPQYRGADDKMEKCDLCLERLHEGKEPLCVATCPLRALKVGPLDDLRESTGGEQWAPGLPDTRATGPSILFRARVGYPGES
ncbi:MAG: 4Fe-4S dicluster domain-containing protein [Chloroflexi bacterium]|nr:4Fe-4S dicluster domain-containing protein [Chloroflexota bacterium]